MKVWKKLLENCDRCGRRLEAWVEECIAVDFSVEGDHVRCVTCKREGEVVDGMGNVEWESTVCKGGCTL